MGRVIMDYLDIKGNKINMEQRQQMINPSRATITRGNGYNFLFASDNNKENSFKSSISSIYGQTLTNSLKKLDWSKYSAAFNSGTLLDFCDEDISYSNASLSNFKSSSDVDVESSFIRIDEEKEDENGSLRIMNHYDDDENNWEEDEGDKEDEEFEPEEPEEEENEEWEEEEEEEEEEDDENNSFANSDEGNHDIEALDDKLYESQFRKGLEAPKIYRCAMCYADLFHSCHIISRDFWGSQGKAYFVKQVINIMEGCEIKTTMRTGVYTIGLLSCAQCDGSIGWKYLESMESSQNYKIDKYVIEENRLNVFNFPNFDSIL